MGQRFLIDSNAIIDFTGQITPKNGRNFVSQIIDEEFIIPSIVKIEVLGFNESTLAKSSELREFLELAILLPLDDLVIERTIALRKAHRKLKLGDAIIAATALVHNLTLITRNVRDFNIIPNLTIVNPHEL
jgi:predicted nucleic acid-binding protein